MKDSKLAYLSMAIIFHSSGTRLNRRWVMVAYLRSCIYNKIINLHLLLSEEPKHTRYTDKYPANTHTRALGGHWLVVSIIMLMIRHKWNFRRVWQMFSLSASSVEQNDTHTIANSSMSSECHHWGKKCSDSFKHTHKHTCMNTQWQHQQQISPEHHGLHQNINTAPTLLH